MKFLLAVFALLLSITANANARPREVDQTGPSTAKASSPALAVLGPSFYVVDPGVLPSTEIYRDIGDSAISVFKKSWQFLSSIAQEGKRLVVRYYNIAESPEIYATTNILPDDILLFQIPAFTVPPALQNMLTAESKDHPFTAQLQINVQRSSGKKYPFFQTRRIGVADEIFVVELPADEENDQPLKYLQGRDIVPLTYTGGEYYNMQNDLIFEVRGQEIYNALRSLRYNSQNGDTFDFSLAIITNKRHPYIYHTEEINLDPSQFYIEKTIDGVGSPDPALVAIYANEKRLEQQLSINFFMGKILQDSEEHKTNFQTASQQFSSILQTLQEEIAHTQQEIQKIQQEMADLKTHQDQAQNGQDRLTRLEEQLQSLTDYLTKSEEETKDLMRLLEQYGARISPIPSELVQDGRMVETEEGGQRP